MHIDAVIIRDDQVTELPKLKGKAAGQRYRHGLTRDRVRFDRACLADPCNMQLSRLGREEIAGSGGGGARGSTAACCLDGGRGAATGTLRGEPHWLNCRLQTG